MVTTEEGTTNDNGGRWESATGAPAHSELLALLSLLGLCGEELGVDVGEDSSLGDDDRAEEAVELLVVADRELQVAGDDARLLVVARGVAGELEDLSGEVLEDGGEVDGRAGADAGGVVAAAEEAVDAPDRKLQACFARARVGLGRVGSGRGLSS